MEVEKIDHANTGRNRPALTRMEAKLLSYLKRHKGRICSREELLKNVWELTVLIETRTVDVHVAKLRKKLGPEYKIKTARNGYLYVGPEKK